MRLQSPHLEPQVLGGESPLGCQIGRIVQLRVWMQGQQGRVERRECSRGIARPRAGRGKLAAGSRMSKPDDPVSSPVGRKRSSPVGPGSGYAGRAARARRGRSSLRARARPARSAPRRWRRSLPGHPPARRRRRSPPATRPSLHGRVSPVTGRPASRRSAVDLSMRRHSREGAERLCNGGHHERPPRASSISIEARTIRSDAAGTPGHRLPRAPPAPDCPLRFRRAAARELTRRSGRG
jgi:hypothetical protein